MPLVPGHNKTCNKTQHFSSQAIPKRILDQGVFLNILLFYLFRDCYAFYYTRKLKETMEAADREGEIIPLSKLCWIRWTPCS
ncbi:uncharacterized protein Dana_GF26295 [Drosophila ananassae]|uniref:Uncharacterized protein n=1 Tax=Drosophila ananassae TaxID=7217 RepID=A0A0P8XKE2_DROAN|nr:uncharacterized protein Dana_GF26295 [Drosophila ananassae]